MRKNKFIETDGARGIERMHAVRAFTDIEAIEVAR
jgi:hypothetical protein